MELGGWLGLLMSCYLGHYQGHGTLPEHSFLLYRTGPLPQAAQPFCSFNSVSPVFNTLKQCEPHSVLGQRGCPGVTPLSSFTLRHT